MIKTKGSRKCLIYKAFDKTNLHSVKRLQPAVTWIHPHVVLHITFATRYLKSMNNMEDIFKKDYFCNTLFKEHEQYGRHFQERFVGSDGVA